MIFLLVSEPKTNSRAFRVKSKLNFEICCLSNISFSLASNCEFKKRKNTGHSQFELTGKQLNKKHSCGCESFHERRKSNNIKPLENISPIKIY